MDTIVDESSTSRGSGAKLILINPKGAIVEYTLQIVFPASNNEAKYEALIIGLKLAKEFWVQ